MCSNMKFLFLSQLRLFRWLFMLMEKLLGRRLYSITVSMSRLIKTPFIIGPTPTVTQQLRHSHMKLQYLSYIQYMRSAFVYSPQCSDLGVIGTSNFYSVHIDTMVKEVLCCAETIIRAFSIAKVLFRKNCVVYSEPILEYVSTVWNLTSHNLERAMERVQRQFTRCLFSLHFILYEQRLF